jgi:hypothetical protein
MAGDTSIGPEEPLPSARGTQVSVEDVDAQSANEFDIEHALAGAEAKPFRPGETEQCAEMGEKPRAGEAEKSNPQQGLVAAPSNARAAPPSGQQGAGADRGSPDRAPDGSGDDGI